MDTDVVMRFGEDEAGEAQVRWRPTGEVFDPRRYEVAIIPDDTTAKAFVERYHYAHTYPSARVRIGCFDRGAPFLREDRLCGLQVYSHPMQDRVLDRLPCDREETTELGRFVMLDRVESNVETWFMARGFELLYKLGYRGIVSFSDPVPRSRVVRREGRLVEHPDLVHRGHVGTIYQAKGFTRVTDGTARTLQIFPDGTSLPARSLQKVRALESRWEGVAKLITSHVATTLDLDPAEVMLPPAATREEARAWVARWIPQITRPLRHRGNLCYVVGLDALTRKLVEKRYGRGRRFAKFVNGVIVDPAAGDGFAWAA